MYVCVFNDYIVMHYSLSKSPRLGQDSERYIYILKFCFFPTNVALFLDSSSSFLRYDEDIIATKTDLFHQLLYASSSSSLRLSSEYN